MSFIQSIRASHLNRHGFIDVLVGITVFQAINITLIVLFGNLNVGPDEDPSITLLEIAFLMLFCLLYTSPSPRDQRGSRMPSSA